MFPLSNYGGDGDQAETSPLNTPTTFSELVQQKVMTLISGPAFIIELLKKLLEWRTQINEEPKPEKIKPCNILEIDNLILPKALTDSLAALEKNNKEFAETLEQTVNQCVQLKESIDVLSLQVHNMVERDKLRQLPPSHIEDSRVTFTCVGEEVSKCDHNEKTQLKDRFKERALKVQNMVKCKKPLQLLSPQFGDNYSTFTCFYEEEPQCNQTEKKDQFEELPLEVHNIAKGGKLRQSPTSQNDYSQTTFICTDQKESKCDRLEELPLEVKKMAEREVFTELPPSRSNDSQATFSCEDVEETKCIQTEKTQLYNHLLNKFQHNILETSLENRPSKLIISKTVTKFRPPYSKFFLNMAYVWDFSSSSNSLTEDVRSVSK